jgi:hypothetical protein
MGVRQQKGFNTTSLNRGATVAGTLSVIITCVKLWLTTQNCFLMLKLIKGCLIKKKPEKLFELTVQKFLHSDSFCFPPILKWCPPGELRKGLLTFTLNASSYIVKHVTGTTPRPFPLPLSQLNIIKSHFKTTPSFRAHSCITQIHRIRLKCKRLRRAIPVTGRGDLYGCEMLRIPHCLDLGSPNFFSLRATLTPPQSPKGQGLASSSYQHTVVLNYAQIFVLGLADEWDK